MKTINKKMKILLITVPLLLLLSFAAWLIIPKRTVIIAAKDVTKPVLTMLSTEYTYNIIEKGRKFKNIAVIQKKGDIFLFNGREIKENEKDVLTEAKLNKDYETLEWKIENPKKNIKVSAVRTGNKIILTGTFDKKENNKKEINIDDRKWLQVYQLGIMKFAGKETKDKNFEFWCLNPDDPGSSMVLFARHEGRDTIEIDGKKIPAAKVKIGLAGLMSVFWTGDYWFRVPEGVFVMAKVSGDFDIKLKGEKKK